MSALDCLKDALREVQKIDDSDDSKDVIEESLQRLIADKELSPERKLAKAQQEVNNLRKASVRKKVQDELSEAQLEKLAQETEGFDPKYLREFRDRVEEGTDPTVARQKPSMSAQTRYLERKYQQRAAQILDPYMAGKLVPRAKDTRELSRALLGGETTDATAIETARLWNEMMGELFAELRKAGVYVEQRPNHRPQNLSPGKLAANKDRALTAMADLMDKGRHPDAEVSADAVFSTLQRRHTLKPGDRPLTMERKVHYRTDEADKLHDFLEEFGQDSLAFQMFGQIRQTARALAMAREFGPDPGRVVKTATREMRQRIQTESTTPRRDNLIVNGIDQTFDALSGTLDASQNVTASDIGNAVRGVMPALYLGRVGLSLVGTDSLIGVMQRARVQGFGQAFKLQAQGTMRLMNKGTRQKLNEYYGIHETLMHMGMPNSRFSPDPSAEGLSKKVQQFGNGMYRLSGAWDVEQGLRKTASYTIGRGLGDAAQLKWNDLDPRIKQDLESGGVTERIWQDVNKFGEVDEAGLFNWNSMPRESAEAMGAWFHRTLDHTVIRPDNRTRALLFAGARRGSLPGEITSSLTQFLQWPTVFARTAMFQQLKKGLPGFAVFSGALFAGGMATEQLYALSRGEPAYEWDSPRLLELAARRSGLMTPIGEWVYGGITGDKFMQPGLGPAVDTVMSTLGKGGKITTELLNGEADKAAAATVELAEQFTPNLFWFDATIVKPAVKSAQQALDPDHVRRDEQRFRDENRVGY